MNRAVYGAVGTALSPLAWWGRLRVSGLDLVRDEGPLLVVANHDSQMDPVLLGLALLRVRPVRFIARANLFDAPALGGLCRALGGIPIRRGEGDRDAIESATAALRDGEAVAIFPEGRLSGGHHLRARTGVVRLWRAHPETRVVLCAITSATDYVRFPRRPSATVRFLAPSRGQPRLDEDQQALATRLLDDVRAVAPPVSAGRRSLPGILVPRPEADSGG